LISEVYIEMNREGSIYLKKKLWGNMQSLFTSSLASSTVYFTMLVGGQIHSITESKFYPT